MIAGDQARVTVSVAVPPATAFDIFTREIDLWWRRGPRFRALSGEHALIAIEGRLGGRVFESQGDGSPAREIGRVLAWEPPARLLFEWRASNFAPAERTEVEVQFEAAAGGRSTRVTVTHRGWAAIRPDHPVRHGQDTAAFLRLMGLWWGDQLAALRLLAVKA
jgi:uncharacterized protein YndB with AHSA1/START domain